MKHFSSTLSSAVTHYVSDSSDFPGEICHAVHTVLGIPVRDKTYNYVFDLIYGTSSDCKQARNYLEKRLTPSEINVLECLRAWFFNIDRKHPGYVGGCHFITNLSDGLAVAIVHDNDETL